MRVVLLLAVLTAACEAEGLSSPEQNPSAPPPIAIAPGTLVVQTWQFDNRCPSQTKVTLTKGADETWLDSVLIPAKELIYVTIHCAIGEEICYDATVPGGHDCAACTPGVLPARRLNCH